MNKIKFKNMQIHSNSAFKRYTKITTNYLNTAKTNIKLKSTFINTNYQFPFNSTTWLAGNKMSEQLKIKTTIIKLPNESIKHNKKYYSAKSESESQQQKNEEAKIEEVKTDKQEANQEEKEEEGGLKKLEKVMEEKILTEENKGMVKKLYTKIKESILKHGKIGVLNLIIIDIVVYLTIYYSVANKVDIDSLANYLPEYLFHYKEYLVEKKEAGSINYAVAFIIWKMISPIRLGSTALITPFVRNLLEKKKNKGRFLKWLLEEIQIKKK